MEALKEFCLNPRDDRFLAVYAPAGFGKSALLACFSVLDEMKDRVLLHLCGGSERSNPMNVVFSLLNRNKNIWNRLSKEMRTRLSKLPGNYDEAVGLFQDTLEEYSENCGGKGLSVIIDGVDEAEVAWPNLPLWNLLYVKEKDEEGNESIRPWDIPENVRIVFGYREGTTERKDIPTASIDILQPMRPLGEGSVDQAFARFRISKAVRNVIIDHGRPFGSREGIDPSYLRFVYNDMLTGRISPENAASVPRGLTGLYMSELGGRSRYEKREETLRVLASFALADDAVTTELLSLMTGTDRALLDDFVLAHGKWFNRDSRGRLYIYHDRFRMFALQRCPEYLLRELNGKAALFVETNWNKYDAEEHRFSCPEEIEYSLEHGAHHVFLTGDHRRLCDIVSDERFRKNQVSLTGQYDVTFSDLNLALRERVRVALENIKLETGNPDKLDLSGAELPELCRMVLLCGEVGHEAENDISIAFEWAREGRVEDAMRRVGVIKDENRLFKALFLILWIVIYKADGLDDGNPEVVIINQMCEHVLKEIDERIPSGTGTIAWEENSDITTMAVYACYRLTRGAALLVSRMPDQKKKVLVVDILEGYEFDGGARFDISLDIASMIDDVDEKNHALSIIASSLASSGEFDYALEIASGITHASYKSAALAEIALSLDSTGEKEKMKDVFKSALETVMGIDDADDKSIALAKVASSLASAGEYDRSLEIVSGIDDASGKSIALSSIASTLFSFGEKDKAKDVFQTALEIAFGIASAYSKSRALSSIASSLVSVGEYDRSLEIASGIANDYEKSKALELIASSLASVGECDRSLEIVSGIGTRYAKNHALLSIVSSLASVKEFDRALEIASGITNVALNKSAFIAIVSSLTSAGEFDRALEIASGIEDDSSKNSAISSIVSSLASVGNNEKARDVFQSTLETGQWINDVTSKYSAVLSIVSFLAADGEFDRAVEIASEVLSASYKSTAFAEIVSFLASSGEYDHALDIARSMNNSSHKCFALLSIASSLTSAGKEKKVRKLLQAALETIIGIDDADDKGRAFSIIASSLESHAEYDLALEIASKIYDDNEKIQFFLEIMSKLFITGEKDKAIDVFQSALDAANNSIYKPFFLISIASSLTTVGEIDRALEVASGIDDHVYDKNYLFVRIASYLVSVGQKVKAKEMFENNLAKAYKNDDYQLISSIASSLASMGEIDRALEIASGIASVSDKSQAFSRIASYIASTGDKENSIKVFQSALETSAGIDDDSDMSSTISIITSSLVSLDPTLWYIIDNYINSNNIKRYMQLKELSLKWMELLCDIENPMEAIVFILRALLWIPYDIDTAAHGVYKLFDVLLRLKKIDIATAITFACSQLGLAEIFRDENSTTESG